MGLDVESSIYYVFVLSDTFRLSITTGARQVNVIKNGWMGAGVEAKRSDPDRSNIGHIERLDTIRRSQQNNRLSQEITD